MKSAVPLKLAFGVKVTVPLGLSTAVPPTPLVTLLMVNVSPSTSLSLPSSCAAVKVTGVSSVAVKLSALAIGAVLIGAGVASVVSAAWLVWPRCSCRSSAAKAKP